MTTRIYWLSALCLVVCLHLVCAVPPTLSKRSEDPPSLDDAPMTIDQAMRRASGGGQRRRQFTRSMGSRFIDDGMDLVLTAKQYSRLYSGVRGRGEGRTVATPWTDGIIPYEISPNNFTDDQVQWIKRAMQHWEDVTCVRFRPKTSDDRNYITIQTGLGCWAHLGMLGQNQIVNLDPYCFWKGIIEHELGHTIGLIHEHQRPQRDAYIRVNYYGVQYNFVNALEKYARGSDDKLGLDYDYTSVMHYGKAAFSTDGVTQTLFPRDPTQEDVMGMIAGPSYLDAKLVNMMYQCGDKCSRTNKPTCPDDCVLTEDCTCFCKQDMPKEICEDKDGKCDQWMREGECRGNSFYMFTFCRKSCGICRTDNSTPRLPCINGNDMCEEWARTKQCENNPGYMHRRCRLACGLCDPDDDFSPKGPCRDKNSTCPQLADQGGCVRDPIHMLRDCTKSCDFCPEDVGHDPSDRPGQCKDFDGVCYYWKDSNLCGKNYAWMSQNCRKACGYCDKNITLPEGCVDKNRDCHEWAMNGECESNPGYMKDNCQMSCDTCKGLNKPPEPCQDYNMGCAEWAKNYECWGNPKWMHRTCAKSCKVCPEDPPTQPPPCMNYAREKDCIFWQQGGECEKNPIWMASYCKKSCNKCTGNEPDGPVTDGPDTGNCNDNNDECRSWADHGECDKNPGYMHEMCRKSCNQCGGGGGPSHTTPAPGACVDENDQCPGWANYGECDKNPGYMNKHCRKSCHQCSGGGGSPDTTTPGACTDENEQCRGWADYGECEKNPGYMHRHCKRSCNVCNGGGGQPSHTTPGGCVDEVPDCADWANYGECDKNPSYMKHHCRKSCNVC